MSKQRQLAAAAPAEHITTTVTFNPLAVAEAKAEAIEQLTGLQAASIDNDDEAAEGAALLVQTVDERKQIESMREGLRAPLKAALKAIDALFAPALQAKEASERKLRELVGQYQLHKAGEQRRLLAEAAKAAQQREPAALTTALAKASAAEPGKLAGVGFREVWAVKRIDAGLVPHSWCTPDEARIKKHARETPIDREPAPIAGVFFERVASTTVRS